MIHDPRQSDSHHSPQAEQLEPERAAPPKDVAMDAYRFIERVVHAAPIPPLPTDFASRVAQAVRDHDERAQLEVGCVAVAFVLAAIAAIVFAVPIVIDRLSTLTAQMPDVPWPLLLVSGLGIVAVACADAILPGRAARNA